MAPAVVLKPEEGLSTSFMLVRNQDPMETVYVLFLFFYKSTKVPLGLPKMNRVELKRFLPPFLMLLSRVSSITFLLDWSFYATFIF